MKFIALICFAALLAPAQQPPKKRIAVLDFDYATVQSSVSAIFNTNQDVGRGIADIMVEKLVNTGKYSVIERKALERVLAEQNFSNSDRADPNTAAKLGRVLGVDAILMGSITQFGRDDKSTSLGGSVFGGAARRYGLGGVGTKSSKAVVGITARLVSPDTAEILAAVSGKGESTRSGASLLGAGGAVGTAAAGALDMTSSNFANTILGEAVTQAVSGLVTAVNNSAANLPTRAIPVEGLIADVNGDVLILNVGSRVGVRVGETLQVKRFGRTIKDPATGRVLRRIEEPLGEIKITEVDEASATGKFSGEGTPQVGDAVKR